MHIQPFKICLVFTNFALLIYLVGLIIDHYNSHYNIKSFSSAFHILCFLWLGIRGIFWISTMTTSVAWTPAAYYFLYWMPVPLEFGSFMLLPLYFAQILYPNEWKSYWRMLRPFYIVGIMGLLSFQAIYILMSLFYEVSWCGASNCRSDIVAVVSPSYFMFVVVLFFLSHLYRIRACATATKMLTGIKTTMAVVAAALLQVVAEAVILTSTTSTVARIYASIWTYQVQRSAASPPPVSCCSARCNLHLLSR